MFSSKLLGQYQTENLSTHFNLVTYSAMLSEYVWGWGQENAAQLVNFQRLGRILLKG